VGDTGPIGFVGLGNMGVPMCRNLAEAGFDVAAFDVREDARASASNAHNKIAARASLAELAKDCRIIILMLPDSRVVNSVTRGSADGETFTDDGLAALAGAGATLIDMSSSFAPETVKLGRDLAERDITLIDAPVSGGVRKAITGELAIMVGGRDAAIDRVASVLEAMGNIFRAGALGSGHATKALNNYLSASSLIATAEALLIGQKFGLDPKRMNDVFRNSTGRSNTTDVKVDQYFIPETYTSGFALALLNKDVGMAHDMAKDLGMEPEMLAKISDLLTRAKATLDDDIDHTAMHAFLKKTV